MPAVLIVTLGVAGVVVVTFRSGFQAGAYGVSGLMAVLALARAVLPERWLAGLVIRSVARDVLTLVTFAAGIALLAANTPNLG